MSGARGTPARGWRERALAGLVVVVGLAMTGIAYWFAEQRRLNVYRSELANIGEAAARNLEGQVQAAGAYVEALGGFFESSSDVTAAEFEAFARRTAARWPGLFATSYQSYVSGDKRVEFESGMRVSGVQGFQISDRKAPGEPMPAAQRDFYLPITYLFSRGGRVPPVGLDLQVYAEFMAPKWRALDSGRPASSRLMSFEADAGYTTSNSVGFVINTAVLNRGDGTARTRLRGFASATFLVDPMVRTAVESVSLEGLQLHIKDAIVPDAAAFKLDGARASAPIAVELEPVTQLVRVPGGAWTLQITPTRAFFRGAIAWYPLLLLVGGVTLTFSIAVTMVRRARDQRRREMMDADRRAAERKFHEIVENMSGAVTVFGANETGTEFLVWDMNAASAALVREGCPQLVGGTLKDVYGAELHEALQGAMRRVWSNGRSERLPPFAHTRAGGVRWLAANVFKLGAGEVVTVCTDVTAQKEVEQELRQARSGLELALDASRIGLWSWDRVLRCAHIDRRTAEILDVGTTQVLQEAALHERIHADDLPRVLTEVAEAVAQGRDFESEVRFATRDGSWRRLCLRARPVVAGEGAGRQIVGCLWDATQRRRQEETKQQRQRMDSISTLAAGIAHDLNNALAPLAMGLDLLRLRFGDDAEAADTLATMGTSARKAAVVVKQLSGLSRSRDDGAATTAPERLLDLLREQLRDSFPPGIAVKVPEPAVALPLVQASMRQLHQAIQAICVNAREVMCGDGTLTITARCMHQRPNRVGDHPELEPGDYVSIEVRDTGPGIADEIRDRIFDPFFTTKGAGRGTGLGLPMALTIVRAMGGTIGFVSTPGSGTCFSIVVPVATTVGRAPERRAESRQVRKSALHGATVLLADDDVMVCEVARRVLESAGMRVVLAADGREAVQAFTGQPDAFDVVVLDVVMPNMDGATAGAAIHALRPNVPMIGASGYAEDSVREQVRAAAFTSFLPKPYTMDGLLNAVRSALKKPAGV